MTSEATVANAVYLQRTSPNFAQHCIERVTDPTSQFLFSDADTPERRLYLRLLDEARAAESNRRDRPNYDGSGQPHQLPPPLLFFSDNSGGGGSTLRLSDYDVNLLWANLRDIATSTASASSSVCGASPLGRKRSRRTADAAPLVVGPHAPHLFASKAALRAFLADLLLTAEASTGGGGGRVDALIAFLSARLPQTEAQLYVMAYTAQELMALALRRHRMPLRRPVTRPAAASAAEDRPFPYRASGDGERRKISASSSGGGGGGLLPPPPAVCFVEGAATLLYAASSLLAAHQDRESRLLAAAAAAGDDDGTARELRAAVRRGGGSVPVYYQAVFDRYLTEMVGAYVAALDGLVAPQPLPRLATSTANTNPHDVDDNGGANHKALCETAQFVLDTVRDWAASGALGRGSSQAALDAMTGTLARWESHLAALISQHSR